MLDVASLEQRFDQPEFQPESVKDLYPRNRLYKFILRHWYLSYRSQTPILAILKFHTGNSIFRHYFIDIRSLLISSRKYIDYFVSHNLLN